MDLLRASASPVSMTEGFRTVYDMPVDPKTGRVMLKQTVAWVQRQGYSAVFYPSISMDRVTLWLSHMRLAPIQIASYGQPVSTYGSEVDYWLAGESVGPSHHLQYSERHVLLPGMGILHSFPQHYGGEKNGADPALWLKPSPNTTTPAAGPTPIDGWFCESMDTANPGERQALGLIINTQAAVHKSNQRWLAMLVRLLRQVRAMRACAGPLAQESPPTCAFPQPAVRCFVPQVPRPVTLRLFPNLRVHDRLVASVFARDVRAMLEEAGLTTTAGGHVRLQIMCPPGPSSSCP